MRNSLPDDFWQDLSVSLLALTGLVGAGLVLVKLGRRRSSARPANKTATRRTIALRDEGPSRLCRNPVPSLDAVIMSDDWPSMVSVGALHSSAAARRSLASGPDTEALGAPVMTSYRFYALNAWGVVDSGTGGRFESDAAAFAHARRIADDGGIEVWRNGAKLKTIDAGKSDSGFTTGDRHPAFA